MNGYILDTNVFNWVLDGKIELPPLNPNTGYYATHVQLDELNATPNLERRTMLLKQFSLIDPDTLPTESFVLGISRLDLAKLSDGVFYNKIKTALDDRNKGKPNNIQDALIVETAMRYGLAIVTEDSDLLKVAAQLGGSAIRIHEIDITGSASGSERKIAGV